MKPSKNTNGPVGKHPSAKSKKNPHADVKRNVPIYFALALIITLFAAYSTINYKTFEKSELDLGVLDLGGIDDIEIPITQHAKELLPPPPPLPNPDPEEDVYEDEEDLLESEFASSESSEDDAILDEPEIVVEDDGTDEVDVPFVFIEQVPVFPGCENGNNEEQKSCMSQKIIKFVQKNFKTELAEQLGLSGTQTIRVMFKIDKTGNVTNVQSRAPHPRLEQEAARVINLLPQMKPGMQRGEAVNVTYHLPIAFQVVN